VFGSCSPDHHGGDIDVEHSPTLSNTCWGTTTGRLPPMLTSRAHRRVASAWSMELERSMMQRGWPHRPRQRRGPLAAPPFQARLAHPNRKAVGNQPGLNSSSVDGDVGAAPRRASRHSSSPVGAAATIGSTGTGNGRHANHHGGGGASVALMLRACTGTHMNGGRAPSNGSNA
jgi:hypothetical protein